MFLIIMILSRDSAQNYFVKLMTVRGS